jgi:hypothetical protein
MTKDDPFFKPKRREQLKSDGYVDDKEIRDLSDLRPLQPGRIQCLKCDQFFDTWDVVLNRRCDRCKASDSYEFVSLEELAEEYADELLDTTLLDEEDF